MIAGYQAHGTRLMLYRLACRDFAAVEA